MNEEHPTTDIQPDAESTPAAGGSEAGSPTVASSEDGGSLTLAEINQLLGKQYKDKETALKSLKDMSSQAGKVSDLQGRKEEADTLKERLEALELDNFFARNPEHESNREILEALALKYKTTVPKAVELDAYQEFAKRVEKKEKRTTVMDSKNRQQSSNDRQKALEDAKKTGEWGKFLIQHHVKTE